MANSKKHHREHSKRMKAIWKARSKEEKEAISAKQSKSAKNPKNIEHCRKLSDSQRNNDAHGEKIRKGLLKHYSTIKSLKSSSRRCKKRNTDKSFYKEKIFSQMMSCLANQRYLSGEESKFTKRGEFKLVLKKRERSTGVLIEDPTDT